MFYFAYGSNMDWDQMKSRCPSTRFVNVALLPDFKLAFTRRSTRRRCGVADVVEEAGRQVWGVVYDIDELDVGTLDQIEGYMVGRQKNSYCRREGHVLMEGDFTRPATVSIYFADPQADAPLPNAEYKALILGGARHWGLPSDYVMELEAIKVAG